MQVSVTDSITNVTVIRDVERIEILSPSKTERKIEVYLEETIKSGNKQFGNPVWLKEPLVLDWNNPKLIQALQLFREVIEGLESNRIRESHKITK